MKNHIKNFKKCSGFTLLEVLIALLVLAIGVLGVAALQFQALKFNHDAYLRTQINISALDIIDQMRLNRNNIDDYLGNYELPNATGACDLTIATDAANDLACWRQNLIQVLPAGSKANISTDGTQYTVDLVWKDRNDVALTEKTVSFTFQP
jgi:type IV pilus assembly protein PilV